MRDLPEVVGNWVRDQKAPAPEFPDACPRCSAPRTNDPDATYTVRRFGQDVTKRVGDLSGTGTPWASYGCGATYTPKPQIQNHTECWWGVCGA